jgi:hypothetical protein
MADLRVLAHNSSVSEPSIVEIYHVFQRREGGSAMMAEDRSWMYTGRQSRTSITPEWAEKAMEFVELAFRRVPPDGCVWCPCACCGNRRKQSKYDMQIHLGKNGFQPDYTVWVYHGESRSGRTAKPSPGDNGNLDGKKDVEVAAAGGEKTCALLKDLARQGNVFEEVEV